MTDKEYKAFSRKISKLYDKWIPVLGLGDWDITCLTVRGRPDDNERHAECKAAWEYKQGIMRFYAEIMEDLEDEEIEAVFLHECSHILLNEMREFGSPKMTEDEMDRAMPHEERSATQVSAAILAAYNAGYCEGTRE